MTAYEETLHVNPEKNFEELNNEFAKVKLSEKLAYCVGDPALTVIYTLANTLLVYFYTNVIGLSAGIIGMIMLLSRGLTVFLILSWVRSLIVPTQNMEKQGYGS